MVYTEQDYTLTITKENMQSTDDLFHATDRYYGTNFKVVDVYLERKDGEQIRYRKTANEQLLCTYTLPRLACQLFEEQLAKLSATEKLHFPISLQGSEEINKGLFESFEEYEKQPYSQSYVRASYSSNTGRLFVLRSEKLFFTTLFAQECLKRFGEEGDRFILIYKKPVEEEKTEQPTSAATDVKVAYQNECSQTLLHAKNIILHGAPGTGKTHLAREIAADIISNGKTSKYEDLSDAQKEQMAFVQFHPSFDYTDFVEGLRPTMKNGVLGFELRDGLFTQFVAEAKKAYPNPHVLIIDEINRGEISKIFGELFFSIDPDYRGETGAVSTQYANLHENPREKFYVPDNVYIIGTMNDIDRSVESFDFAMRRRFRFLELRADECIGMLDQEEDAEAIARMAALNQAIHGIEDFNRNYQIGGAYFKKYKAIGAQKLWEDYLEPLLREYVQGMYEEERLLADFKAAYFSNTHKSNEDVDENNR